MSHGYIKHKVYIPLENVDIDKIRHYYTIPLYNEQACARCKYFKRRPCEYCENCQSFLKNLELWSVKTINGKQYCLVPSGNLPKLEKITGIDFSTYIDLRCASKQRYTLEWTGQLRNGNVVNGVKTADQVSIVKQWMSPSVRYGFIQAPPRTGKSVIGDYIAIKTKLRTLFVAHQKELLVNFYNGLLNNTNLRQVEHDLGRPIAKIIEKPSDYKLIETLDYCFVTYQSFIHDFTKLKQYILGNFGLVIVDEAHQAGAEVYAKFMSQLDCKYKLGMSATPLRKDSLNRVLFNVIGPVTVKSEATGLVPKVEIIETGVCCTKKFRLWTYAMKFLQTDDYRNDLIIKQVENDLKSHKCIIIPVDTKSHMDKLVNQLNSKYQYPIATGYHSKLPSRKTILTEIDSGKYRVVVAIRSMIKQGIDLYAPSMIYVQSPMSAKQQPVGAPFFYQLGNRVCTPYEGKPQPVIKVFIDNIPESYGCFTGLFTKEINPGLKPNSEGRSKYKMDAKTIAYCWKIVNAVTKKKNYSQVKNVSFNPAYDVEHEQSTPTTSNRSKLLNLFGEQW